MASLTLCMIVKNEEEYLKECLESVKLIADEIVIVDTGSTDNTINIAHEYGAKIFTFNWVNDFSAARNFALEKSTGNWILYLDADERLDSGSIAELKNIISYKSTIAYYCTIKSYDNDESRDNSILYPRLFANSNKIKFVGKVHEQIETSLAENKYRFKNSNILIHHIGYNISKEEKQKKALRNLKLLIEEYELKETAYIAFQLGQTYNVLEQKENATKYLLIASQSKELEPQLKAQSLATLSLIAHTNNNTADAEKYIQLSIKLDDSQPFSYLLASKIALRKGDIKAAEEYCVKAYKLNGKLQSGKELNKVAVYLDNEDIIYYGLALALQNKNSTNISFYKKEILKYYDRRECLNGVLKQKVVQKLFSLSKFNISEQNILVEMANKSNLNIFLQLLISNPDKEEMLNIANQLNVKFPNTIEVQKTIAKMLESSDRLDEAISILEKAVEKDNYDASVLLYLISFYLQKGDSKKIILIIEKLESKYSNMPEVIERVKKLKEKLQL